MNFNLKKYGSFNLRKMIVSNIGIYDVLNALTPFLYSISETASRIRGCIEALLNYEDIKKYPPLPNPATRSKKPKRIVAFKV